MKEIWTSLEVDCPDLDNALADVDAELADLKDRLAAADERIVSLEGTAQSAKDQLLRLTADFDNFRKRTANEKEALGVSAKGDVVTQLLPLVDNFELARNQVKAESEGEQKINNAYQGLYKQMVDILRTLGVETVDTTGSAFDPELHDAIMREPSEEVPDGTVLQEFRKGFKMGARLLRPAMVKVSFSEKQEPPSTAADESVDAAEEVAA